jgi:hypothetical protein
MPRKLTELRKVVPEPVNQVLSDIALIEGGTTIAPLSSAPTPAAGYGIIYVDSATGDIVSKSNVGGTVKTQILLDYSAL